MSVIRWSPTTCVLTPDPNSEKYTESSNKMKATTKAPATLVLGASGSGKMSPISEPIITPDRGIVPFGSLTIGSYVFGRKGQVIKVTGIYPQGKRKIYTIILEDGRTLRCGKEHLFTIIEKDTFEEKIVTLQWIINHSHNWDNIRIPNNGALEFEELEIDDYYARGKECAILDSTIDDKYLYNSINNRISFALGLLEGYSAKYNNGEYNFSSNITNIDSYFRSLGNLHVHKHGNCISIKGKHNHPLFNQQKKFNSLINTEWLFIVNVIEEEKEEECRCITVSADDRLYISGEYVVSHNTFFMVSCAASCMGMGQRIIVIDPKDDFKKVAKLNNKVQVIDVNKIRPGALNPFTFLSSFDTSQLQTVVELLCGKLDHECIIDVIPILQDFITKYKREGEYKDMQDVADYLFSRDSLNAQRVGTILKTYEGSVYGSLLFTREEDVTPLVLSETDSVVISLKGMTFPESNTMAEDYTADQRFTATVVYILTLKLYEVLAHNKDIPTCLFCDEAHMIFANKKMALAINRFLTMGRSLKIATVLMSQSMGHFPQDVAQHVSSKFMFKSSNEEAKIFLDKFGMSNEAVVDDEKIDVNRIIGKVSKLETGECFFMDSYNKNGFIKVISPFGDLL